MEMNKPDRISIYTEMIACQLLDVAWERMKEKVGNRTKKVLMEEINKVLTEWDIDVWRAA